MTAFTAKVASLLNAGKGLTTTLINQLWDNTAYAKEQIEAHIHDGVGSAKIPIGANYMRNGSFEDGTTGWAITNYTGGSNAVQTSGATHGQNCLAITSTVLANGGGDAISNEFLPCSVGELISVFVKIHASVTNVSSRVGFIWYDSAQAQISSTTEISYTVTPTTSTAVLGQGTAPSAARYFKILLTGGVPASGTATGTVYFDGLHVYLPVLSHPVSAGTNYGNLLPACFTEGYSYDANAVFALSERFNARVMQSGIYKVTFLLKPSTVQCYAQIYKNGVAYGTYRTATTVGSYTTYSEDLAFVAGDTVQLFTLPYNSGSYTAFAKDFRLGILNTQGLATAPVVPLLVGDR